MLSLNPESSDKSLRVIIPVVVGLHLLMAILLNGLNQAPVPLMPKKGVVVHSVKLSPKVFSQATKEVAEAKKEAPQPKKVEIKEEVKSKAAPVIKAEPKPIPAKPNIEKKPVKATPKPVEPKKVADAKKIPAPVPKVDNKEWIAAAKEKISKIALSSDSIPKNSSQNLKEIATPSLIENFTTDLAFIDSGNTLGVKESAYRDELAKRLRLYLKLPEYGEVKIKLTVDRLGAVIFVKVLSFQSAKNASFIEQNLPKLKMPSFGDNFKGSSNHDFTIVLSNE